MAGDGDTVPPRDVRLQGTQIDGPDQATSRD